MKCLECLLDMNLVFFQVNADNTVTVEMVDYGNVEICKAAELRKNICMTNIPLQCHKCSFKQLQPVCTCLYYIIYMLHFYVTDLLFYSMTFSPFLLTCLAFIKLFINR